MKKREALSLAMNLSWTMWVSLLLPQLAGVWLDKKLGTVPRFILIGAILGISAATIGVARMTIRTFDQTTKTRSLVEEAGPPDRGPDASDPEVQRDPEVQVNGKEEPA